MPDQRTRSKREQLFTAAKPLFERFGFRKTTIEEICAAAGVSKRTFYELFNDKTHFFALLLQDLGNRLLAEWEPRITEDAGACAAIEDFLDFYHEAIAGEPIFGALFETPELMAACSGAYDGSDKSGIVDFLAGHIRRGMETGEFRKVDPDYVAWIIGILLDDVYIVMPEFFKQPGAKNDKLLAAEVRAFILNGLMARD